MLVVRALKISQLTDGGMPPTYDSMHYFPRATTDSFHTPRLPRVIAAIIWPRKLIRFGHGGECVETAPKRLVCFCQLSGALLREQFPFACHGRLQFLCTF